MTLAVIGCGNPNRRDDGVGPEVIARLRRRILPEGVGLYDAGTDGMAVMYRARGASHLIIVDARAPARAGNGSPGTIYDVPGEILEAPPPQSLNLHGFRWDHALYAGRKIYGSGFPTQVKVFLVEAGSLDLGLGLTESVEAAADRVAEKIAALSEDYAAGGWA